MHPLETSHPIDRWIEQQDTARNPRPARSSPARSSLALFAALAALTLFNLAVMSGLVGTPDASAAPASGLVLPIAAHSCEVPLA